MTEASYIEWQKMHSALVYLNTVANDDKCSLALRGKAIKYIQSIGRIQTKENNASVHKSKGTYSRVCRVCGSCFTKKIKPGPKSMFCSAACRVSSRYVDKNCCFCGIKFKTQNIRSKYCSPTCASKANAVKVVGRRPKYICRKCGKEFFRPKRHNDFYIFCSRRCAGTSSNSNGTYNTNGNYRQRAKHFGVEYKFINTRKVFERDLWTCQICGKKTPKKNRGTNYSNAPELDHRTPMSLGGSHTYDNVQCSCRACNRKKSNKSSIGQLPLFGVTQ